MTVCMTATRIHWGQSPQLALLQNKQLETKVVMWFLCKQGQCSPSHPRLCPQYATERCSCCCKSIQQRMLFAICYSIGIHLCRLAFAASIWPGQSAATKTHQLRYLILLNRAIADVSSPLRCHNKRSALAEKSDRKVNFTHMFRSGAPRCVSSSSGAVDEVLSVRIRLRCSSLDSLKSGASLKRLKS
jgi:hypothetical protein